MPPAGCSQAAGERLQNLSFCTCLPTYESASKVYQKFHIHVAILVDLALYARKALLFDSFLMPTDYRLNVVSRLPWCQTSR